MNQLSLLLRNRVALIAIGAVVVVAAAFAVASASGANLLSGSGTPAQCASDDFVSTHSGTPTGDRDENGDQNSSKHKAQGHQCSGDDNDGDHDGAGGTHTPSAHSGD
jgi:hypothetical protein